MVCVTVLGAVYFSHASFFCGCDYTIYRKNVPG